MTEEVKETTVAKGGRFSAFQQMREMLHLKIENSSTFSVIGVQEGKNKNSYKYIRC